MNNNYFSIYQMDVKYAFFNGPLEEEVYVVAFSSYEAEYIVASFMCAKACG